MSKRHDTTSRRLTVQSNTYRFFVAADGLREREVRIENAELAHQIANVLRLRAGDQVLLLDNTGLQHVVTLGAIGRGWVEGAVERTELAQGEPRSELTLYLALIRPEKFEWVLQKGTELGVSAFVPLITERSMAGGANELNARKIERWQRVIREAAEQSRRGRLPQLAPALALNAASKQASQCGMGLLLWEGSGGQPLRQALTAAKMATGETHTFSIFSGPEGGFADHELEAARGYGIMPVTLGPRTLRAETAPLAAAAAIFYEMGDME